MTKLLGAQMYTVREFTKTEENMINSLEKTAAMGYGSVQLSGHAADISPSVIANTCAKLGLRIGLTHNPYERLINDTNTLIAEHKLYACDYIGLGSMPKEFRSPEGVKNFADTISPALKKIKEAGLNFVYHNHSFEFESFDGSTLMHKLLEKIDPELMGLTCDLYWLQHAGLNPARFVSDYAKRIVFVHVKDMTVRDGTPCITEFGQGNMDWDSIIPACKKAGVLGYYVEQDNNFTVDCFDSLEVSIKNAAKMGID